MPITEEVKNIKYESVIPKGSYDTKFNKPIKDSEGNIIGHDIIADFKLVTDLDELKKFAETCKGKTIAVDTETTGLSYIRDVIVGFSISLDSYSGIYVPIRHKHKKVNKQKVPRLDENGEVMLTKAGKPRQITQETYEFFEYEHNVDPKQALDILYQIMLDAKIVLMHNSEYDMNMIKKEGYDVIKCKTFDTMILPYLYDAEARLNGLKPLTKWLLGRHVQDFSEVTGGEKEFQYTNPEESYVYAASDSSGTFGVFEKLYKPVLNLLNEAEDVLTFNGKRYNVLNEDNKLIRAFIDYYGHAKLKIDRNVAIAYRDLIDKQSKEVIEKVYNYFGVGPFSLSTGSKEFQGVMQKFHMETGAKTKTGNRTSYGKEGIKEMNKNLNKLKNSTWEQIGRIFFVDSKIRAEGPAKQQAYDLINYLKTYGKPYFHFPKINGVNIFEVRDLNNVKLDKLTFVSMLKEMYKAEKQKLEILESIQKYSSLMKALNSYVTKLTEVDECIMKYRLTGTKSCRFSSGNGSKNSKDKNDYYIDLNAQNLTKPTPCFYRAFPDNSEGNILGWGFEPVTDEYAHEHLEDEYIVEGTSKSANIRACIVAPEGKIIASMDYSSEEALAIAELSGDALMISNFKNGIDPHKATAIAVYGKENYNKFTRRKAKQANFLLNYGGQKYTLANNMDIPLEEAEDIVNKYYAAYFMLAQWKQSEIDKMYKNKGKIFTKFGRPRQLLPWLRMAKITGDESLQRYAERSVCSHQVQGLCGDICRRLFIVLYERFFKNRDVNIDFVTSVHDEVNYAITNNKEILINYLRELQEIMDFPYLMPDLPIRTSIDLGYSLGTCFPFVWTDDSKTELVPKREH